eukprot:gene8745-6150_t
MSGGEPIISHEAIIRHICSFLDANGYSSSLIALQAESGVPYNVLRQDPEGSSRGTVSAPLTQKGMETAVLQGQWDDVLKIYMDKLLIPSEVKATVYELILEELLELHGLFYPARSLLLNAPIFEYVKETTPARYARLEKMIETFDPAVVEERKQSVAFAKTKEHFQERRAELLRELLPLVTFSSVPRIPEDEYLVQVFLQQAREEKEGPSAKRPRLEGPSAGLENTNAAAASPVDWLTYPTAAPKVIERRIAFEGEEAAAACLQLSDQITVVGRVDGTLEFIGAQEGSREKTLSNPSRAGVLTLTLDEVPNSGAASTHPSPLVPWIAVGYRDGTVRIFDGSAHQLLRKFDAIHNLGVTTVAFVGPLDVDYLDGHHSLLVSGSFDTTMKLLSIRDGTCLYTVMDAHRSAPINSVCALVVNHPEHLGSDDAFLSAGNDGRVSCWFRSISTRSPVVERMGHAVSLRSFHKAFEGNEIPTALMRLEMGSSSNRTVNSTSTEAGEQLVQDSEVLIVTKSRKALILRVRVSPQNVERPVHTENLCLLQSTGLILSVSPRVFFPASNPLPLLSLYCCTDDGSLQLYSLQMPWRHEERWKSHDGCIHVTEAVDVSVAVAADVGKAVLDLRLARVVWRAEGDAAMKRDSFAVFACAASLNTAYVLR